MKIRPVVDELFHADRRTDIKTDMTKLIVAILRTRLIRISERCCLTDDTNGDKYN